MKKIRMLYNKETCIGCGACQIACKERNGLMEGEFIRRVTLCAKNTQNGNVQYPYSFSCNHCKNPKCIEVCPTKAMYKAPDGTVLHDDTLCIACGRCYWACSFGEVSFSKKTGLTQKCDLCLERRENGQLPKCVSFCPTGSLRLIEEEIEEHGTVVEPSQEETKATKTYLLLGGGAASLYAALAIREEDKDGRIIMLSEEKYRPYRRPMLSKTPFKTFQREKLTLFKEDWFLENHVELHLEEKVLALLPGEKTVQTEKGCYHYDKCIYALGANAFIPPFPGRARKNVFAVRTIEDIEAIKHASLLGNNAVIIGGGVIGIEFAMELRRYGMEVTILEAMPRLMARQLDEDLSFRLLTALHSSGIHAETGVRIAELTGGETVDGVRLEDNRFFPASFVIVSCGVKANKEIAEKAGIKCQRAVVVNSYMETNLPDIYACGDTAEWNNRNYALWAQAMEEGTTAGRNAAGKHQEAKGFDTSLILNSESLSLFALGDVGLKEEEEYLEITSERLEEGFQINDRRQKAFRKLVFQGGTLRGVALLGSLSEMEALKKRLEEENP